MISEAKIANARHALMIERDTLRNDPKNGEMPGAAVVNARAVAAINDYLDNASDHSLLRLYEAFTAAEEMNEDALIAQSTRREVLSKTWENTDG